MSNQFADFVNYSVHLPPFSRLIPMTFTLMLQYLLKDYRHQLLVTLLVFFMEQVGASAAERTQYQVRAISWMAGARPSVSHPTSYCIAYDIRHALLQLLVADATDHSTALLVKQRLRHVDLPLVDRIPYVQL